MLAFVAFFVRHQKTKEIDQVLEVVQTLCAGMRSETEAFGMALGRTTGGEKKQTTSHTPGDP